MRHAFTIDLEDWHQGIPIGRETRSHAERRLEVGTHRLLEMLARRGYRATFFVLGTIANEYPELLRLVSAAGHDVGSHGISHDLIYEMTPERFSEETRRSVGDIEECIGKKVTSYRAAYFSITKRSLWALDILAREGIQYDSSVFPIQNWRYGIPDYSRRPTIVDTAYGRLFEFPISTLRLLGRNVPVSGGAYFRIYPYLITRFNFRLAAREGFPVVFYIHPWELDPEHPVVHFDRKAMVTHYFNLRSTAPKLERLLEDFEFGSLREVTNDAFPGTG